MGSTPSLPENVYQAVARNNQEELKTLCSKLAELGQRDPQARAKVLEWRDKDGRTPLLLAANKNYYQTARLLLQNGADALYVNNTGRGNALHEAAHQRHEAMVELLLMHGAQPFMVNAAGRTPMDEAVSAGHVNILRRLEREALFAGFLAVKEKTFGGFSSQYKTRWVVVMHRFPNPQDREPQLRKVLWIYKDRAAFVPRVKVWLDGATAVPPPDAATDGVVRLHATHPEPNGTVFSRYDRGYCLFFRPAPPSPSGRPDSASNAGPPPADALNLLMMHCNPSQPIILALSPTPPSAGVHLWAASNNGMLMTSAGAPRLPVEAYPTPVGSAPTPRMTSSPMDFQRPPPPPVVSPQLAALAMAPAPYPSPTPPHRRVTSEPMMPDVGRPHLRGGPGGFDFDIDVLQALPGETDQQFAARLASAIAPDDSSHGGAAARPPSAPGGQPSPRDSAAAHAYPQLPSHMRTSTVGSSSAFPPAESMRWPSARAPPPLPPPVITTAPSEGKNPSAPPLMMADAAPAASVLGQADGTCVICLSAERSAGFLHGTTVHACACSSCAAMFHVGTPCPMCRAPVERVLGVF